MADSVQYFQLVLVATVAPPTGEIKEQRKDVWKRGTTELIQNKKGFKDKNATDLGKGKSELRYILDNLWRIADDSSIKETTLSIAYFVRTLMTKVV